MQSVFSSVPRASTGRRAQRTTAIARGGASLAAAFVLITAAGAASAKLRLETVLPPLAVEANASVFATPLAYRNGAVYTANVEPSPDRGSRTGLQTVIRRGEQDRQGRWRWQSQVIESETVRDPYHTEASIALDRLGYVHVVYGMHDVPWQYSVSRQPDSIDRFIFRGQPADLRQRRSSKDGRVVFPGPGTAAIPGNQVTYPAFFNDRRGRLYVTYRYAVRPKVTWYERTFAGAIARYNAQNKTWKQIGGNVRQNRDEVDLPKGVNSRVTHPFAMQQGWWVYQPRLAFDRDNGMHVSWMWRRGNAGPNASHPSYAYSPDGSNRFYRSDGRAYRLPIGIRDTEIVVPPRQRANASRPIAKHGFYNPARLRLSQDGTPSIAIQPLGANSYGFRPSARRGWRTPEKLPYNALQIRYDDHGNEWAFATGLTVLKRRVKADGTPHSNWRVVFKGGNLCNPRMVEGARSDAYYIHANILRAGRCRTDRVTVVRLSGLSGSD